MHDRKRNKYVFSTDASERSLQTRAGGRGEERVRQDAHSAPTCPDRERHARLSATRPDDPAPTLLGHANAVTGPGVAKRHSTGARSNRSSGNASSLPSAPPPRAALRPLPSPEMRADSTRGRSDGSTASRYAAGELPEPAPAPARPRAKELPIPACRHALQTRTELTVSHRRASCSCRIGGTPWRGNDEGASCGRTLLRHGKGTWRSRAARRSREDA